MPPFPTPLIAAISDLWINAPYQIIGMLVVFSALAFIWICLELVGASFRRKTAPLAAPAAAPGAAAAPGPADLDSETLAAIAAAVHIATDSHHRIISIEPSATPGMGWSQEGRRQIYQSHRIR